MGPKMGGTRRAGKVLARHHLAGRVEMRPAPSYPPRQLRLRPRKPKSVRADRTERAGNDLGGRLHAAERPVRGLLLLDPDPDVAAEVRTALPLDLDQEVGDAFEQLLLLRGVCSECQRPNSAEGDGCGDAWSPQSVQSLEYN